MKILGLEFSSDERSVSVAETGTDFQLLSTCSESGRGVSSCLALINRTIQAAQLSPREIDAVAVGLGPGSYAGIRSAIALGQGWQLARRTPLLGISSAELIAFEAFRRGIYGEVSVLINAQRSEFYEARYEISSHGVEGGALTIIASGAVDRCRVLLGPPFRGLPEGAIVIPPTASALAQIAATRRADVPGETLEPIYLRETAFVKAPPGRAVRP